MEPEARQAYGQERASAGRCAGVWPGSCSFSASIATAAPLKDSSLFQPLDAQQYPIDRQVRFFTPNDPYFFNDNPVGFPGQWYLDNQIGAGTGPDANVSGVWDRGITGTGVVIGFVDDGLEHTHPDLSPNYDAADSWDFGQNDADPMPVWNNATSVNYGDNHGTSVAGVAGARGGNGEGITGAAPDASLAGLRIDFSNQTAQMFADATRYHSSGSNTSIDIKNHSYGNTIGYFDQPITTSALIDSYNAGTIHFFAAGNYRQEDLGDYYIDLNSNFKFDPDVDPALNGDANKEQAQAARQSIVVAALGSDGVYASYSEWGANVFVTAPSSDSGNPAITTTDRVDDEGYNNNTLSMSEPFTDGDPFPDLDYNSIFGGTSSASPLAAGVMALAHQVRPDMDARFAKHLLARTSQVVDAGDDSTLGGWTTNAAGFKFNPNYGFGLIDADALTQAAAQYVGVTPVVATTTDNVAVNRVIPDGNTTGITESFLLAGSTPIEDIEVTLDVTHPWRGDVGRCSPRRPARPVG